ncbi:MAG TPA: double-strand break repair helicase AddA [Ferrovibrio sp.]|uniref:double-strand break repair helicase AddA n=1 Tax=Ferrovibrio sp. TaxID=1917215 RepID=UPI002ED594F1
MSAEDGELRAHLTAQRVAADPALSAWVAANAGSGKTRVLVDRVTRLLLAGTRPSGILCLTFTKAAAAEMALRLTDRLGAWTTLPDDELKAELFGLLGRQVEAGDILRARKLFARTLEAPGGLRLQTVHAFCEALLQRFPVEAGVPPGFAIADDAVTAELFRAARDRLLSEGLQPGSAMAPVIRFFAERMDDTRFERLFSVLIGRRRDLAALFEQTGGAEAAIGALYHRLGLPQDATRDGILRQHIDTMALDDLRRAVAALLQGGANDGKLGQQLDRWLAAGCLADRFETEWLPAFFTKSDPNKALDKLASKMAEKLAADCGAILQAEQKRLVALKLVLNALTTAEATAMLLRLAARLLRIYGELKAVRGLLDYDDLILRSRDLLVEPGRVPWVMFKLDQGIDHILVDEAQDTSPDQWAVIAALAEDFFSGSGAREAKRTIFAVGDVKQSIYSFQGARPKAFLDMRRVFSRRAEAIGERLHAVPLEMSFRSAPAILQVVDAVFEDEAARRGLAEDGTRLQHRARRREEAGRIELWPPFKPDPKAQSEAWDVPVDYVGRRDPRLRLAETIAAQIKRWMAEENLPSAGRKLRPGDVMILVRRRNVFFEAMVQALKKAGVPVAGADRMTLIEQIAVLDLLALGAFCLLPEDDLNLATVLKGPLFNFSEDDLFALCWQRQEPRLWRILQSRADEQPHWRAAVDELRHLMARTDLVSPFAFYAELLGAGGGRRRLVARLGAQANEPIDEFLAAALNFEREAAPSLQGFIAWFRRHAGEVKRDLEQTRDEVRVLTVHGAKGLEAPVVILPDCCDLPQERNGEGLLWDEASDTAQPAPQLYWPLRKDNDTPLTAEIRAARQAEQMAEYRRLLYVALTRARDRLYVCGYLNGKTAEKGPPGQSWYSLIEAGLNRLAPLTDIALPWGERGRRFESFADRHAEAKPVSEAAAAAILPAWARQPAPPEPTPPRPLSPSQPSRSEPPPLSPTAPDRLAGLARGRLIHRLLQTLPDLEPAERAAAAGRFLAHPAHRLSAALQAEISREVLSVLQTPGFEAVFQPGAQVEAPLAGRLGDRLVVGQVDRLIVNGDRILVVDYKTNRPPPSRVEDVDPAYLEQMALYRALLQQIFPHYPVQAALLWTYAPRLMPLPPDLLDRRLDDFTAT